ncbi:T9SS type A sorting domain-containing protein [Aquimarina sp. MAR_2010_214]|uniref:T9SS type A sorting domain-containing protein n=1 Tax=Aquimarina sp. MAR_2010_214 TaxID=1250026 RepID=UPI000C710D1D|nr:T9SS type A sorting domain-containing protein [Aquimarina sp. MAR_2010_214]
MKTFYIFLFVITSIVGHAQTVTTILDSPTEDIDDALALDSEGNLYGSNFSGDTVYKITPSGEISAFVTGLSNPNGLAFDSEDNLFVVEYTGAAIRKYDNEGNLLHTYPVGDFPSGIIKAFCSDAMIFTYADFGNAENNSVNELLPDGTIRELYQGAPLSVPVGLTFDHSGVLYIGNYLDRKIYRLRPGKNELKYIATVPDSGTNAPYLAFIAYAKGSLYGTVYGEHKIYKIHPWFTDRVEIFAGSTSGSMDGDISEATFSFPSGIISNKRENTLYVSEFSGVGNVRKISLRKKKCNLDIKLKAYPNPVSELLNIKVELSEETNFRIKVESLFGGNVVFESQETYDGEDFLKTISVENWSPGFYRVLISKNSCRKSKLLIVR